MLRLHSMLACAALLAAAALTTGCGSDDDPASPPSEVEGRWSGVSSTGVDLDGVVLPDGSYWIVYTDSGDVLGLLQGRFSAGGGGFTSSDGRNFNSAAGVVKAFTAQGTYNPNVIEGSSRYDGGVTDSFTLGRAEGYAQTTTLSSLARRWSGLYATVGDSNLINLTAATDGSFSGQDRYGCRFSGRFSERPEKKAVVDVSLKLDAATCDSGDTLQGVAMPNGADQLVFAATWSDRSNGIVAVLNANT